MRRSSKELSTVFLDQAIKLVGVGPKGRKDLSESLVRELSQVMASGRVDDVALAAFLGGLFMKGVTDIENRLEDVLGEGVLGSADALLERVAPCDLEDDTRKYILSLLNGVHLDRPSAEHLGHFLFDDSPGDALRGLVAIVLRVGYETPDEYLGLLDAMKGCIQDRFTGDDAAKCPDIQLAEPFDGTMRSWITTPLIGSFLREKGLSVVHSAGVSGGPKIGNNLYDVLLKLGVKPMRSAPTMADTGVSPFGRLLTPESFSPMIHRWVGIRKAIRKRPFLATLERIINPLQSRVLVASAFHAPYTAKMVDLALETGFSGVAIVHRGLEGGLSFPLGRHAEVHCAARRHGGGVEHQTFKLNASDFLEENPASDAVVRSPSPDENANLIERYQNNGGITGDKVFDARVSFTCRGLWSALEWTLSRIEA